MASLEEIRKARLKKLEKLQAAGLSAYPGELKRTHTVSQLIGEFSTLEKAKKEVIAVGRIKSLREHGGSTFFDIEDGTGAFQVYLKKDGIGESAYSLFLETFDIGDFAQVRGTLFSTKKGEKTLEAKDFTMLAKSLLPLPEKWHGLQDVEERYRKRYLDLLFNPEVKKKFEQRSKIVSSLREFLGKEGFMEVETPILQPLYGGAEAKPFTTHLNAFDMDMFLRIAPELYLKRLLVGGYEKVYEIGRIFRNEGVDRQHNPDFTELEFYWAYADYKDMMKLVEQLFAFVLKEVFGGATISYEGKEINFKVPFERIEYTALIKKFADVDIESSNKDALFKKAKELGVSVEKEMGKFQIADAIYKKFCLPKLWEPTFVIHHPAGSKPLAKELSSNPSQLASFQLIVAGWELINAFSEQNDPLKQKEVFEAQVAMRKEGMADAHPMDEDFIEALEYGMPPAAGFGMGIDRLTALLTDSHSLREVILFPTMKPKE
ncbi:MAG: lysine--tRNA ligase [Candidatus Wildermuthbacteria bacterium RIFCSPHIGHO2_02_FULL_49_12b]|nr:MAG: lysine--tRNA ligase [Candidatus Wildermuthbacteria bacterium RIFCSPHIGHO2_02_FULL_49_12b]